MSLSTDNEPLAVKQCANMHCLVYIILVFSLAFCTSGTKFIVATGFTERNGFIKETEIIDLDNPHSKCLPWANSLLGVQSAVGGIINEGLLICAGSSFMGDSKQCQLITPVLAEETVSLNYASFDSSGVVLNEDRLFVIGGVNFALDGELNRTEFVSTNYSTLGPTLPQDLLYQYCAHKIDEKTVMVIGRNNSYFYSIKDDQWNEGPHFSKPRSVHACGSFRLGNRVFSIAAGGDYVDDDEILDSSLVEIFAHDDGNEESQWIAGPRLPYPIDFGFKRQIVFNEKELFFIDGYTNVFLKLVCDSTEVTSCHWEALEHKLEIPRLGAVMALIPEELAVCTT